MKITAEQLAALRNNQVQSKPRSGQDSFESLLAQEMGSDAAKAGQAASVVPPLTGMIDVSTIAPAAEGQGLATGVEKALDQWEDYARELGATGAPDLRKAYDKLQAVSGTVKDLKDKSADAPAAVKSLINELDVMAVTEKIKFNRGDYA